MTGFIKSRYSTNERYRIIYYQGRKYYIRQTNYSVTGHIHNRTALGVGHKLYPIIISKSITVSNRSSR